MDMIFKVGSNMKIAWLIKRVIINFVQIGRK
jgi:hypothetical protein